MKAHIHPLQKVIMANWAGADGSVETHVSDVANMGRLVPLIWWCRRDVRPTEGSGRTGSAAPAVRRAPAVGATAPPAFTDPDAGWTAPPRSAGPGSGHWPRRCS